MRKSTKSLINARVDELLSIRLDGATFVDVRQYVAEKEEKGEAPWVIPDGEKPLSVRTLWRYLHLADEAVKAECRATRASKLRWAKARRNRLYAKATNAGDYRTALAVLVDLSRLEGLYPDKDDALRAELRELERKIDDLEAAGVRPQSASAGTEHGPATYGAVQSTANCGTSE